MWCLSHTRNCCTWSIGLSSIPRTTQNPAGEPAQDQRQCEYCRHPPQPRSIASCSTLGRIQPDPSRVQPLWALRPPSSLKELKRVCGLFTYYAKWIANFSKKSRPLQTATEFPLTEQNLEAFNTLKNDLITASLGHYGWRFFRGGNWPFRLRHRGHIVPRRSSCRIYGAKLK